MQKKLIGRTGVEVTRLGLGCAPLGDLFSRVEESVAREVLNAAWDSGIRYFDTSPYYGHGKSEHRLGEFLRGKPRSEVVVSTKVGRVLVPTRDPNSLDEEYFVSPLPFTLKFDYSYDGIMRSYEDSLQRLGISHVDVLFIHDLDLWFHRTNARLKAQLSELATSGWRALDELRSSGQVKAIGAGINDLGLIPRFLDLVDLDLFLVAQDYNLLDHEILEVEFPMCSEQDVVIIVGAIFASGILATTGVEGSTYRYAPATPDVLARVRSIADICQRYAVDIATAAVQFPLANPLVVGAVPGATRAEYVRSNVERLSYDVPPELWQDLKSKGLIRHNAPTPG